MGLQLHLRKRRAERAQDAEATRRHARGRRAFLVRLSHTGRRHYELQLQFGDALKTWSIAGAPSVDPAIRRIATEGSDQPLDIARIASDPPRPARRTALFDQGVWTCDGDPDEQLEAGHLRFELHGGKLGGRWHLVRTHTAVEPPQWLLYHARDAQVHARDASRSSVPVAGEAVASGSKAPARRTPSRTEPWAHRAAKLAGARASNHAPTFRAPQLPRLATAVPAGDEWLHEAKWDGYRLIAQLNRGKVRLWSRNAVEWTRKVPAIVAALEALDLEDAVLDGELVAGAGRPEDYGLLQASLAGAQEGNLCYLLFDILQVDGVDLARSPQYQRKALLAEILKKPPERLMYSSHIVGRGEEALAKALARGLEGVVSKRADAPYHPGRGDAWRTVKQRVSDEFAVAGFLPSKPGDEQQTLLLASSDAAQGWRHAGCVPVSGRVRETLRERLPKVGRTQATVQVDDAVPGLRLARWFAPRTVVEVFHHGFDEHGLIRKPELKALREDKSAADLQAPDAQPPRPKRTRAGRGAR